MDIRSFFSPGFKSNSSSGDDFSKSDKTKKKKAEPKEDDKRKKRSSKKRTFDSDSDEDPLPQKLRKTTASKTKVIKESDDEDDVVVIAVKKKSKEDSRKPLKETKKKIATPPKPKLQATNADDFFGSTPISQKPKPTILKKKETKEMKEKQEIIDELCDDIDMFDDDDDFEKSILDLETIPSEQTSEKPKPSKNSESKRRKLIEESPIPAKDKKRKSDETKTEKTEVKKVEHKSPVKKVIDKSPVKKPSPKSSTATPKKTSESSKKTEIEKKESDVTPNVDRKKSFYAAYKSREGPRDLGSKELPEGAENCLEGLTFVITGILESIERDQASDLVKKHGGKVSAAVGKKTSYVVVGRDPGESKMDKVRKFGTKQLDEDALFDLIKKLPGKKSKFEVQNTPAEKVSPPKKSPSSTMTSESKYFKKEQTKIEKPDIQKEAASSQDLQSQSSSQVQPLSQSQSQDNKPAEELLWVDKYKPKAMKYIVGQGGEKSNAKKLLKWLTNWNDKNLKGNKPKGKGGFFAGKEDGSIFKCALLSGPPGVGKTTTANLVCKEAGFTFVEMNASDTRSKKTLQQVISELLSNTTVDNVFQGPSKRQSAGNHALVMDEVDGMAGNEDRGGIQELISLIKNTKIPIICMCNDRNHPKIRSLSNYCFDLRFYKPKVDQIKGFAMTVSCREGLKIPTPVMEQIVVGANQDIRQVLHNLQMWTSTKKSMTFDEAKQEAKRSEKDIKIGPFDIVKKLFSASEKLSIYDKTDLFFNDYSFVPLFVQENYLASRPAQSRGNLRKTLELTSKAADSIADSNLIEKLIRGGQNWSLLPLQGFYSCVYAPDMMRGGLSQRIEFPQWLGKNSSQGKHDRILQELKVHMRLSCLANKSDINLDYLWLMRKLLVAPLADSNDDVNNAAKKVIDLMDAYSLTREDWESFIEIGKWPNQPDLTSSIPSKVKAAFTRTYNKGSHITPYASQSVAKKSKRGAANYDDENMEGEIEQSDDDNDDGDITKDSMIKIKKKSDIKGKPETGKRKMKTEAAGKKKMKK